LPVKTWLFPDGCVGVNLDVTHYKFWFSYAPVLITARINSSNDFMELVMATNALRQRGVHDISLFMPFVPYSRQDRVCAEGDSFSLLAFADLINLLNYKTVTVIDPHSDVTDAALHRIHAVTQLKVIEKWDHFATHCRNSIIVAPDAGSAKKCHAAAAYLGLDMVMAHKNRDSSTGVIKSIEILGGGDVTAPCIIIDDICDGGRTFIELAKVLRARGCPHITLYVTHGIFSKGTEVIYKSGIDEIFTTNSVFSTWPANVSEKVKTLNINNLYL